MIKGVNKRIIEVKETDSRLFESALLFVSPAYSSADEARLKREADRVIRRFGTLANQPHFMGGYTQKQKSVKKNRYPAFFLAGTLLGFVIAVIVFKIF